MFFLLVFPYKEIVSLLFGYCNCIALFTDLDLESKFSFMLSH